GLPIAWLADRSNRRNIVATSLILWSGFTVCCGLALSSLQFVLARIGVGVGEAGATPPSTSIVSDCFPAERRLMALSIFALGAPIGAWLGADTAGAVAQAYGWRAAFFALGVPGVLVGALVFLTIREPRRGRLDAVAAVGKASFSESLAFLWRQRRSEEHTSELQSRLVISYAVFCLKKKNTKLLRLILHLTFLIKI